MGVKSHCRGNPIIYDGKKWIHKSSGLPLISQTPCALCGRRPGDVDSIRSIDPCMRPLIKALNDGGIETAFSCCGHGKDTGLVILKDERVIRIYKNIKHDIQFNSPIRKRLRVRKK